MTQKWRPRICCSSQEDPTQKLSDHVALRLPFGGLSRRHVAKIGNCLLDGKVGSVFGARIFLLEMGSGKFCRHVADVRNKLAKIFVSHCCTLMLSISRVAVALLYVGALLRGALRRS